MKQVMKNKVMLYLLTVLTLTRVHNIIEEENILLSNSLYKRVLQSYDAIVIVTFEVLSDYVMFWKDIDIFASPTPRWP